MERQQYPASMADKQSSFPELNVALSHILILYMSFFFFFFFFARGQQNNPQCLKTPFSTVS